MEEQRRFSSFQTFPHSITHATFSAFLRSNPLLASTPALALAAYLSTPSPSQHHQAPQRCRVYLDCPVSSIPFSLDLSSIGCSRPSPTWVLSQSLMTYIWLNPGSRNSRCKGLVVGRSQAQSCHSKETSVAEAEHVQGQEQELSADGQETAGSYRD